jgi:flagellar hook-associated protein 1 FlgK
MSTIFGGLTSALGALQAQQYALDITQQNIANVNTPGYSRQGVKFTPGSGNPGTSGGCIPTVSVESFRDRFIDYRIAQELPSQNEYDTVSQALQQIDGILNGQGGTSLQSALSSFFNSFSSLANNPDDLSLRQNVLSQANDLANQFHSIYDSIQKVQVSQDQAVSDTVNQINAVTQKIAALNPQVAAAQAQHSDDESSLSDQRQQLLDQLSGLADVSYFETESGAVTITTGQGSVLVIGDQSSSLQTATLPGTSMNQVVLNGTNITSEFQSGKLGGLLKVRDQNIAGYLNTLDDLAAGLIARVNAQHASGSDMNGNAGGDFFTPFVQPWPGNNSGAAHSISVAITDPQAIAAAESGAGQGSNANAQALAGIKDETLFLPDNFTLNQFYAGLLETVGSDYQAADNGSQTQGQILLQLQNQRDSLAGVNLDEEALNIVKFQKAYEASARLAQVWNSLADEVMKLVGS